MMKKINSLLVTLGGCFLVVMILLTCANIGFRQFGFPVRGTFEIMGFLGAVVFALGLSYSHERKEHLYVSILFDKFPKSVQQALKRLNSLVCICFFSLLAWQLAVKAWNLKMVNELSETLRIAYYPFVFVLSFGVFVFVLLYIVELLFNPGDDR